jgi:MYXO-CTERM domain-containing protein
MLRPLPVLCLAALCALAALPAATAQAGVNDPKIVVSLAATPKSPTIPLGGSQAFQVTVTLATTNIFCSSPGKVTVGLMPKDSGLPGVTGVLPASVDVTVAANLAPGAASTTSGGSATATLTVTVAGTAAPDHDHSFTVVASTPAALPNGCQSLSSSPPPAATGSVDVALRTGPAAASTSTGGTSSGACAGSASAPGVTVSAQGSCSSTKKASFAPPLLAMTALAALALVARRRA